MKAIYIHGLDSKPNEEKIASMEAAGFATVALHIDYRTEPNAYKLLKQKIAEDEVEFIVGSSMGGYLAFWLAAELALPCMLLNPAMTFDYSDQLIVPVEIVDRCPFRFVVIGEQDEVVDPDKSKKYFEDCTNKNQLVLMANWMPHVVDNNSFNQFINWAKFSYFNGD